MTILVAFVAIIAAFAAFARSAWGAAFITASTLCWRAAFHASRAFHAGEVTAVEAALYQVTVRTLARMAHPVTDEEVRDVRKMAHEVAVEIQRQMPGAFLRYEREVLKRGDRLLSFQEANQLWDEVTSKVQGVAQ